jgi:hypothetical protein
MGVKTKVFGRFAWLTLEGIGRFYDEYMRQQHTKKEILDMQTMIKEFFCLIGFVLPCVYCRISYREFTTDFIHIEDYLDMPDGGKKFVYLLHNRVTKKLEDQELEQFKHDPEKLKEVHQKWKEYKITYEEALQTKFPATTSYRFWNAVIVFFSLIMCDYRKSDACQIYRFFWVTGRILTTNPNGLYLEYMRGFEKSIDLWKHVDTGLSTRLDIVWVLKKHVFDFQGWTFSRTRDDLERQCKSAIVGCTK